MPDFPSGSILVVGDGDLSYSTALTAAIQDNPGINLDVYLTATTLDSLEIVKKRYKRAEENIRNLSLMRNTFVYFGVDARFLETFKFEKATKFDFIVFNFPHPGGKNCMATNRKLLSDFFWSAGKVLSDDGEIWVTLCDGQGGTPADRKKREWQNSWQVVAMATRANMILTRVLEFDSQNYIGYRSTGHRGFDRGFANSGALTHVFIRAHETVEGHMARWLSILSLTESIELDCPWHQDDVLWSYIDSTFLKTYSVIPCDLMLVLQANHPVAILYERLRRRLMIRHSMDTITGDWIDGQKYWSVSLKSCVVHRECVVGTGIENQPVVFAIHGAFCVQKAESETTEKLRLVLSDAIGLLGDIYQTYWISDYVDSHLIWRLLLIKESTSYEICALRNQHCFSGKDGTDSFSFSVSLSCLAVVLFDIADARLLWSSDSRFFKQFEVCSNCMDCRPFVARPVSIYSCSYQHDVGFWTMVAINDLQLSRVIRSVTGDVVTSVTLINAFRKDNKTGLCYRIVYQSNDKAISRVEVDKLQTDVREVIVSEFGVELR